MDQNLEILKSLVDEGRVIHGCPRWWARVGSGDNARFLDIPKVRGDNDLRCTVEVEDDVTVIYIGVGPNNKHGVRETVRC